VESGHWLNGRSSRLSSGSEMPTGPLDHFQIAPRVPAKRSREV